LSKKNVPEKVVEAILDGIMGLFQLDRDSPWYLTAHLPSVEEIPSSLIRPQNFPDSRWILSRDDRV